MGNEKVEWEKQARGNKDTIEKVSIQAKAGHNMEKVRH